MVAAVRLNRTIVQPDAILIGKAVASPEWFDFGALINWLLGRGGYLIPMYDPFITIAAGTTRTIRARVFPRYQHFQWIWLVMARSLDATGRTGQVDLAAPTGGTQLPRYAPAAIETCDALVLVETRAAQTGAEVEASLDIEAVDYETEIYGIACIEMPRPEIAQDANENGIDLLTLNARQPIFASALNGQSIKEVIEGLAAAKTVARRNGMLYWAVPRENALTLTTTGALQDVHEFPAPVLARCLLPLADMTGPEVTRTLAVRIEVQLPNDGTTAGELTLETTRGGAGVALVTITIPANSGAGAWHYLPSTAGAPATFLHDCDDLAVVDGRQDPGGTPRFDFIKCRWRRTAGTGTISLASISIGEPDP